MKAPSPPPGGCEGGKRRPGAVNTGPQTLLLFVDGIGWRGTGTDGNPIAPDTCPALCNLLSTHAVPVDARLGVPGLPQSATGQTALLTGRNAPGEIGRHVEGFPNEALRRMIRHENLFLAFLARGATVTFANAYFVTRTTEVARSRFQSVTTVAALSALDRLRTRTDLEADRAVYQDLTRRSLSARGYTGPYPTPREAGHHLAAIATRHDFTLFEYFQTDRAAHSGSPDRIRQVLSEFDAFLRSVQEEAETAGLRLVLTSDHGNIEDTRTCAHTLNPVPFAATGRGAEALLHAVRDITQVAPALLHTNGIR